MSQGSQGSLEFLELLEEQELLGFWGSSQPLLAEESSQWVPDIDFRMYFQIRCSKQKIKHLWSPTQGFEKGKGSKGGHLK